MKKIELKKGSLFVINATFTIFVLIMFKMLLEKSVARIIDWLISLFFIIAYCVIINAYFIRRNKKFCYVLFAMLCIESITVSWNVINDRQTYTNDEIVAEYDNGSLVVTKADNSWYRIESRCPSPSCWCGSYIGNYNGLESYIGGLGISNEIISFCRSLGLPEVEGKKQMGTGGNIYANALLGVKYSIMKDQPLYEYGLERLDSFGEENVYYNQLCLPLAYVYDSYISKKDFDQMTILERNRSILQGVVLEDEDNGLKRFTANDLEKVEIQETEQIDLKQSQGCINIQPSEKNVSVLQLEMEDDVVVPDFIVEYWGDGTDFGKMKLLEAETPIEVCANTNNISITYDNSLLPIVKCLNIYRYDKNRYYEQIQNCVDKLQANGMKVESVDRHKIIGSISSNTDGIMATSIPWDSKWKIMIDGKESPLIKVNEGFIGAKITEGNHNITFEYPYTSWFDSVKYILFAKILLMIFMFSAVVMKINMKR
ncbi:YfhO family protein [Butyrivibrio sp. WCD3002]|uniref:YfhO family protein n=1 Tax=Butyrivibrio sp. WCD3002 TaxID=1280676 RepID=UPI00047C3922|nr:YfhO family protein [Butyrivibrio sp. WCD3002]